MYVFKTGDRVVLAPRSTWAMSYFPDLIGKTLILNARWAGSLEHHWTAIDKIGIYAELDLVPEKLYYTKVMRALRG